MINAKNYAVEIDTFGSTTNASLGLTAGVYKWAIKDDEGVYADNILADVGISNLTRSVDIRTGGGLSTRTLITLTLVDSIYAEIKNAAEIVGLRFIVYSIEWNGSSYDKTAEFTGAISAPTFLGFETQLKCYVENSNRVNELSNNNAIFGETVVAGTVSGEQEYIKTLGYKAVFLVTARDIDYSLLYTFVRIAGATPSTQAILEQTTEEINDIIDRGANVYYEGQNGTYLVVEAAFGATEMFVALSAANQFLGAVQDEVGEVGCIYWTDKVYNDGILGTVTIDVDGETLELDDINDNVIDYNGGSVVDAGDGVVWRTLNEGVDYEFEVDTYGGNQQVIDISAPYVDKGVYANGASITAGDVTFDDTGNVSDWEESTAASSIVTDTAIEAHYSGVVFNMKSYNFSANKLYAVIDFTISNLFQSNPALPTYVRCSTTSYADGTVAGEAPIGIPIGQQTNGVALGVTLDEDRIYNTMPKDYYDTPTDEGQFNFYNPRINETESSTIIVDITDLLFDDGTGTLYYDSVRLFIAIGGEFGGSASVSGTTDITIRQINLVEGYDIGVDGLSSNKVSVDNTAINGTFQLGYPDIIKRQNLTCIGSTPPAEGWGAELVEEDGRGVLLDGNYITTTILSGNLNGVVPKTDTDSIKKEIARSVPASSYYSADGKESLLYIGFFPISTVGTITRPDIDGEMKIDSYDINDIHPRMLFEFGSEKKRLQINNVEASVYSSSYVVDDVGLPDGQKQALWNAGHALYEVYGVSKSESVRSYPIVNDSDGAYRIVSALYANMGYIDYDVFPRVVVSYSSKTSEHYDIGNAVAIDTPTLFGRGVVSLATPNVYGSGIDYVIEAIDTEPVIVAGDLLQTGEQTDDVLETGEQDDDILQTGVL